MSTSKLRRIRVRSLSGSSINLTSQCSISTLGLVFEGTGPRPLEGRRGTSCSGLHQGRGIDAHDCYSSARCGPSDRRLTDSFTASLLTLFREQEQGELTVVIGVAKGDVGGLRRQSLVQIDRAGLNRVIRRRAVIVVIGVV